MRATAPAADDGAAWWRSPALLRRFVVDLVAGELAQLRPGAAALPQPWPDDLALDADLGVDSLERVALATSLSQALHLHESGIEDLLLAKRRLSEWVAIAGAGLAHVDERMSFRTSGSTGAPKACVHQLALLRQETRHLAALFPGRARLLFGVPAHHIYGFLFTVLLPRALGLPDEAVIDIRGTLPAGLGRVVRPGDLVVGHPGFWQSVGEARRPLAPDVIGVTSTAPCRDSVAEAVDRAGLARLFQVYGASETAGVGWRSSHRDPYRLFPYWSFAPDRPGVLLRRLPGGGAQEVSAPDALAPSGDHHFTVGARSDGAVQVGGVNVDPALVRDVLLAHPLVADAAVRLMRPHEGERLKAFVVPASPHDGLLRELQAWIDARLPVPARPKAISVGDALPVTDAGKPADWSILRNDRP